MPKTERNEVKVSFPRFARYNSAFKYFIEHGLDVRYIMQPEITTRTLELGTKYSPDYVCSPFKALLGSMIEALESGANTLFMIDGPCRLGYYGELQEQILRDLGYQFEFVNVSEYSTGKPSDMIRAAKKINPKLNYAKMALAFAEAVAMVEHIDDITALYYQNCGFEVTKGQYKKLFNEFNRRMESVSSLKEIDEVYHTTRREMEEVPLNKPANRLRVGIVGELFTVMDPFSNQNIEQHLADMGVEVHRWMNIKNRLIHYGGEKNMNVKIRDICTYEMGPTSTGNIWAAKEYAESGFDGIVHVKGADCTPEIDVMPELQRISEEYKIPVLYMTFDAQTSDVGVMTRLEAFYDMIEMRKKVLR